jgi:hypothetical protein
VTNRAKANQSSTTRKPRHRRQRKNRQPTLIK